MQNSDQNKSLPSRHGRSFFSIKAIRVQYQQFLSESIKIMVVNETINPSKWTHYEVISPPGLAGLAVSNAIIYTAIFITNSLIPATFSKMKKKSLHQYLMVCLAIIDLLTIPAQVPTMVALWKRYIWLTDNLCKVLAIANSATLAATAWLHIAICIEKCCSILLH